MEELLICAVLVDGESATDAIHEDTGSNILAACAQTADAASIE
jgi:hypothetical protein